MIELLVTRLVPIVLAVLFLSVMALKMNTLSLWIVILIGVALMLWDVVAESRNERLRQQ